ncbi:hypothetical protein LBMAG57_20230 [Verrucomicrobiota bacterium]|nr:hypothetical protein LBMAG57_20230 [Verrucomicrobiota bacterium]
MKMRIWISIWISIQGEPGESILRVALHEKEFVEGIFFRARRTGNRHSGDRRRGVRGGLLCSELLLSLQLSAHGNASSRSTSVVAADFSVPAVAGFCWARAAGPVAHSTPIATRAHTI